MRIKRVVFETSAHRRVTGHKRNPEIPSIRNTETLFSSDIAEWRERLGGSGPPLKNYSTSICYNCFCYYAVRISDDRVTPNSVNRLIKCAPKYVVNWFVTYGMYKTFRNGGFHIYCTSYTALIPFYNLIVLALYWPQPGAQ